jgi:hypothetical protein
MALSDTEITPKRILLLRIVAGWFVLDGLLALILVLFHVLSSHPSYGFPLGSVAGLFVGFGLLGFHRPSYIVACWLVGLRLLAYGLRIAAGISASIHFGHLLRESVTPLPAALEKHLLVFVTLLLAIFAFNVWQLWILQRPYARVLFGDVRIQQTRSKPTDSASRLSL